MKGSEDKCSCIKYDENGVSGHFRDAVFISVIFSRGGESFPGCQRAFPAAGNSSGSRPPDTINSERER